MLEPVEPNPALIARLPILARAALFYEEQVQGRDITCKECVRRNRRRGMEDMKWHSRVKKYEKYPSVFSLLVGCGGWRRGENGHFVAWPEDYGLDTKEGEEVLKTLLPAVQKSSTKRAKEIAVLPDPSDSSDSSDVATYLPKRSSPATSGKAQAPAKARGKRKERQVRYTSPRIAPALSTSSSRKSTARRRPSKSDLFTKKKASKSAGDPLVREYRKSWTELAGQKRPRDLDWEDEVEIVPSRQRLEQRTGHVDRKGKKKETDVLVLSDSSPSPSPPPAHPPSLLFATSSSVPRSSSCQEIGRIRRWNSSDPPSEWSLPPVDALFSHVPASSTPSSSRVTVEEAARRDQSKGR